LINTVFHYYIYDYKSCGIYGKVHYLYIMRFIFTKVICFNYITHYRKLFLELIKKAPSTRIFKMEGAHQ
jgi:hypothetical protein